MRKGWVVAFASTLVFATACATTAFTPTVYGIKAECRSDVERSCKRAFRQRVLRGVIQVYPDPLSICIEYARNACD